MEHQNNFWNWWTTAYPTSSLKWSTLDGLSVFQMDEWMGLFYQFERFEIWPPTWSINRSWLIMYPSHILWSFRQGIWFVLCNFCKSSGFGLGTPLKLQSVLNYFSLLCCSWTKFHSIGRHVNVKLIIYKTSSLVSIAHLRVLTMRK